MLTIAFSKKVMRSIAVQITDQYCSTILFERCNEFLGLYLSLSLKRTFAGTKAVVLAWKLDDDHLMLESIKTYLSLEC